MSLELLQQQVQLRSVGLAGMAMVMRVVVLRVHGGGLAGAKLHAGAMACRHHAQGVGLQLLAAHTTPTMAIALSCDTAC